MYTGTLTSPSRAAGSFLCGKGYDCSGNFADGAGRSGCWNRIPLPDRLLPRKAGIRTPDARLRSREALRNLNFKRRRISVALLLVPAVLLGAYLVRVALFGPLELTGVAFDDGYSRANGVVHVHTTLSDGGGSHEDVIAAARNAGLDFVAITDHNNVDAISYEGYHDGPFVLVGSEVSTTAGHVLGIGLESDPGFRFSGDAVDALVDIRDLGGIPFAAHPFSPRDDLAWSGWDLPGPWGIEILNGDSEWRKAGPRILLTMALYQLNARYALLRTLSSPRETLERWDAMLKERGVVGIYGADAHGRLPVTDRWWLSFPSYEAVFSLARNHLLLEEPLSGEETPDRAALLDAIRKGRLYVGFDAVAPADGFYFIVESEAGERWTMGESLPLQDGLRARSGGRVPRDARIRLLRDGRLAAESLEALDVPLPGAGVYRVEVFVESFQVPWVISNPIAVFDRETLAVRAVAADGPPPPVPIEPREILDDFEGGTVFVSGHDTESEMEESLLDPQGGIDGGGAARISFRLGEPTSDHPDVFVAIVSWEHRNLEGRHGITFWIKADGVYRMWVQVRDENPASSDEATEWWFASVKTSADWRRASFPFTQLRSINPRTDGRLDLDKVRAIVFVIDKGAMKPGSRGTIWLDELGVF